MLKENLTPGNEPFPTLMQPRLLLLQKDIGRRFGISHSGVSRIILAWVQFLCQRFGNDTEVL